MYLLNQFTANKGKYKKLTYFYVAILSLYICHASSTPLKRDYIPQAKLTSNTYFIGGHSALHDSGILAINGKVWVWGWRQSGQTGNGDIVQSNAPATMVQQLDNVIALFGGIYSILALDANGVVWGWGQQLMREAGCYEGNLPNEAQSVKAFYPCKVMNNVKQLASSETFSIALDKNGDVWTWGDSRFGQLGRVSNSGHEADPLPARINFNNEKIKLIGNHYQGGFAISTSGRVWTWGANTHGVMGVEGSNTYINPIRFNALDKYADKISYIGGGLGWGTALLNDGSIIGWGNTASLGRGTLYNTSPQEIYTEMNQETLLTPVKIDIDVKFVKLLARFRGLVALSTRGELYTWGLTTPNPNIPQFIYGTVPTRQNTIGNRVQDMSIGREYLYYWNEVGDMFGVGLNNKNQISTSASTLINWPGQQIHYQSFGQ